MKMFFHSAARLPRRSDSGVIYRLMEASLYSLVLSFLFLCPLNLYRAVGLLEVALNECTGTALTIDSSVVC